MTGTTAIETSSPQPKVANTSLLPARTDTAMVVSFRDSFENDLAASATALQRKGHAPIATPHLGLESPRGGSSAKTLAAAGKPKRSATPEDTASTQAATQAAPAPAVSLEAQSIVPMPQTPASGITPPAGEPGIPVEVDGALQGKAKSAKAGKGAETLAQPRAGKAEPRDALAGAPAVDSVVNKPVVTPDLPIRSLAPPDTVDHGQGTELSVPLSSLPHGMHAGAREVSATSSNESTRQLTETSLTSRDNSAHFAIESRTLTATPNVLEVGIASDAHGWLRVRAELGQTGQLAAAVLTTSAHAAEGLHRELPAISAYLASEQVGISSLVIHPMGRGAAAQESTYGSAAGAQSEDSGQRQQGKAMAVSSASDVDAEAGSDLLSFIGFTSTLSPAVFAGGRAGGWLSVRV